MCRAFFHSALPKGQGEQIKGKGDEEVNKAREVEGGGEKYERLTLMWSGAVQDQMAILCQ